MSAIQADIPSNAPLDRQFYSIGNCCQLFSVDPNMLQRVMAQAGVPFALEINGVGHLSADGVAKVASFLREVRQPAGEAS